MNISGTAHGRSFVQSAPAQPAPRARPDGPIAPSDPLPDVDRQLATAGKRAGARIAAAVDSGELSVRQANALADVQKDFDNHIQRLTSAVHEDGASRQDLIQGLDIAYGQLRESLSAILTAGHGAEQPVTNLYSRMSFEPIGISLDQLG